MSVLSFFNKAATHAPPLSHNLKEDGEISQKRCYKKSHGLHSATFNGMHYID